MRAAGCRRRNNPRPARVRGRLRRRDRRFGRRRRRRRPGLWRGPGNNTCRRCAGASGKNITLIRCHLPLLDFHFAPDGSVESIRARAVRRV